MAKKFITTEVPAYAKAPEYSFATRSFTLAVLAISPYGIGVWLFSAFGGIAILLMVLAVLGLLIASTCYAITALTQAQRNERPRLARGWAIAAFTLNFLHVAVVILGIFWLMSGLDPEG